MNEKKLQSEIQKRVIRGLSPLFAKYRLDFSDLEAALKWKPIVLILGNYSSGKSTLINELLSLNIQRTGQAPTDDCFTIITSTLPNRPPGDLPGANVVNDEQLPFTAFKDYGEKLVAHLAMKQIASPLLENLAIIDSPGMLDSISENDRGYDYRGVVGDFAKLADLIVLMFDPHKAGTIQETYEAIRNTLPESSGEDRIVFVMSRIDECDNVADLVRSYGTLCWNLSQMTGRKDIPRVFLTYSPDLVADSPALEGWERERSELKKRILAAPELRISHILQNIDKQANELKMIIEAMVRYAQGGRALLGLTLRSAAILALLAFLFTDLLWRLAAGWPAETFLHALLLGTVQLQHLLLPVAGALAAGGGMLLFFAKWQLPRYRRQWLANVDGLVSLDTAYRKHAWERIKGRVVELLQDPARRGIMVGHRHNLKRVENFIQKELQGYYERIR